MFTRRLFFKSLGLALISLLIKSEKLIAQSVVGNMDMLKFQWRVPKVHYETVKNELSFVGEIKKDQETKGIWIFIFAGTVLLPDLVKAILALRRKVVHGGIVIDTRGKKITIDTDKSLSGGEIEIRTLESRQIYERDELGDASELLSAITKGL